MACVLVWVLSLLVSRTAVRSNPPECEGCARSSAPSSTTPCLHTQTPKHNTQGTTTTSTCACPAASSTRSRPTASTTRNPARWSRLCWSSAPVRTSWCVFVLLSLVLSVGQGRFALFRLFVKWEGCFLALSCLLGLSPQCSVCHPFYPDPTKSSPHHLFPHHTRTCTGAMRPPRGVPVGGGEGPEHGGQLHERGHGLL